MQTRSGKQLQDPIQVPKRKRKSIAEPKQLHTDHQSQLQLPLPKRPKGTEPASVPTTTLPARPASQSVTHVTANADHSTANSDRYQKRWDPNVEYDEKISSRHPFQPYQVGGASKIREVVLKPSAELIVHEGEQQEHQAQNEPRLLFVQKRTSGSTIASIHPKLPKSSEEQFVLPQNHDVPRTIETRHDNAANRGVEMKGTMSNMKNAQPIKQKVHHKEFQERALAMVKKAKEVSATARGAIMFTVPEAFQFLAEFDENAVRNSSMAAEIDTGEYLPYPVQRPYHLGAMGRYSGKTSSRDMGGVYYQSMR